jgi:hypothetical protein
MPNLVEGLRDVKKCGKVLNVKQKRLKDFRTY